MALCFFFCDISNALAYASDYEAINGLLRDGTYFCIPWGNS